MKQYDPAKVSITVDGIELKGFTEISKPSGIELCFKKGSIAHDLIDKGETPFIYNDGFVSLHFDKYSAKKIPNRDSDPKGSTRYLIKDWFAKTKGWLEE